MVLEQMSAAFLNSWPLSRIDPIYREHSHMAWDMLIKEDKGKEKNSQRLAHEM